MNETPLGSLPAATVLDAIPEPTVIAEADSRRITGANDAAERLLGCSRDELCGRELLDLHPERTRTAHGEALTDDGRVERLVDGSPLEVERSDGERRRVVVATQRTEHDDQAYVVRRFEESLDRDRDRDRSREVIEAALEIGGIGVWEYDSSTDDFWWDDRAAELFGCRRPTADGLTTVFESVHPADRRTLRNELGQTIDCGVSIDLEFRIVAKAAETRWVRIQADPRHEAGDPRCVYGTVRDVTAQKERERELERNRERLQVLFDQSPNVIIVHGLDGTIYDVNEKHAKNLGYTREELLSMEVPDFEVGVDAETLRRRWAEMSIGDRHELVGVHRRKDGSTFPAEVWLNKLEIDGDERILAVSRDVSEREARERELARFRQAIEAAGHAIFLTDVDGTITYVNPAFEEITGYAAEEAIGERPSILNSGQMDTRYFQEQWSAILAGELWEEEIVNRRKSGDIYHAHQTIAPITDDGDVQEFVAIQTDVTERKEQERQLNTLDRVLRHNLRNELNVINGHAEVIQAMGTQTHVTHAERIVESATSLLETAEKGRKITSLLSEPARRKPVDVGVAVERAVSSVHDTEVDIRVSTPGEAIATATDRLEEAIEELVDNASRHADRSTPTLEIDITVDETVTVRIADDGPGIPEMERQILDETQTESDLSHGSGLGLWFVYWVVRRSGGRLSFEENDPRGSVVTIELERARSVE
ncbi:PAS domain-containing protein [Natrarchaeobaculum sulfurireducens]|uniref:PAS domain-containing protein n=1 Tax=Natrarchaeobaculum sulfurireducens TaxID=2044521 RepID=UPI001379C3D8|nr:PAS domain S-box protein [Natrarchaeobaculum sulfurireducens]